MTTFRWGIFGTGAISAKFVLGLKSAKDARVCFVASRSGVKAKVFASAYGIKKGIEGYVNAIQEPVDAIYIATPPSEHLSQALACIAAGIPVLVEKPLATTKIDTQEIVNASQKNSVFAMEAVWTRFLPAVQELSKQIDQGVIGDIKFLSANFGSSQIRNESSGIYNAGLGGGALGHLSSYPLSLAQMLFGSPILIQAMGRIGPTGVDEDVAMQLSYENGVLASFLISIQAWAPDSFGIFGTKGTIRTRGTVVRPFGLYIASEFPREVGTFLPSWRDKVRQSSPIHAISQITGRIGRAPTKLMNRFYRGNGYHYEADEVMRCVLAKRIESEVMPHADSISVAGTIDAIRAIIASQN